MVAPVKRGQRRGSKQGLRAQARRKSPWLPGSLRFPYPPCISPHPLWKGSITYLLPRMRLREKFFFSICWQMGLTLTLGVKGHRKSWPSASLGPSTIESSEGRRCFWERLGRQRSNSPGVQSFLWEGAGTNVLLISRNNFHNV